LIDSTLEVCAVVRVDGLRSSSPGDEPSQRGDECFSGEASHYFDVDSFGRKADEDSNVTFSG
jgi:hypothetical protein